MNKSTNNEGNEVQSNNQQTVDVPNNIETGIEKNETGIEPVIVSESKPVLGVCEQCKKKIDDENGLFSFEEPFTLKIGKKSRVESRNRVFCKDCNEIRLLQEQMEKEEKQRTIERVTNKRRIHSFIWPSISAFVSFVLGLAIIINGDIFVGVEFLIFGVFLYTFIATMILDNTFITEMWTEITSWGFVKLPGIIFELSIDGLIFLIVMKVILFLLGMVLGLLSALFATVVTMALSIFVYPFALRKNLKEGK